MSWNRGRHFFSSLLSKLSGNAMASTCDRVDMTRKQLFGEGASSATFSGVESDL